MWRPWLCVRVCWPKWIWSCERISRRKQVLHKEHCLSWNIWKNNRLCVPCNLTDTNLPLKFTQHSYYTTSQSMYMLSPFCHLIQVYHLWHNAHKFLPLLPTFRSFDLDPSRSELRRPSFVCSSIVNRYTHKEFLALGLLFKEICVRDSNGTLHLN